MGYLCAHVDIKVIYEYMDLIKQYTYKKYMSPVRWLTF